MTNQTEGPIILVRPEQPALTEAIDALYKAHYERHNELELVHALRRHDNFEPKLALVALFDGIPVGHALYHPIGIQAANDLFAVALATLAIDPPYQGQMIGSALVYQGMEVCRRAKADVLLTYGPPAKYAKFGFRPGEAMGLHPSLKLPGDLLVLELTSDVLDSVERTVLFPKEYEMLPL